VENITTKITPIKGTVKFCCEIFISHYPNVYKFSDSSYATKRGQILSVTVLSQTQQILVVHPSKLMSKRAAT
jgi:hypothetical protein